MIVCDDNVAKRIYFLKAPRMYTRLVCLVFGFECYSLNKIIKTSEDTRNNIMLTDIQAVIANNFATILYKHQVYHHIYFINNSLPFSHLRTHKYAAKYSHFRLSTNYDQNFQRYSFVQVPFLYCGSKHQATHKQEIQILQINKEYSLEMSSLVVRINNYNLRHIRKYGAWNTWNSMI